MAQSEATHRPFSGATGRLIELARKLPQEKKQMLIRLLENEGGIEQRQFTRQDCSLAAGYRVMGREYKGVIQNMSAGGVFIRTWKELYPGQTLWISFELPRFEFSVDLSGEVVHTVQEGVGIRFVWHPSMQGVKSAGIRP